VNPRYIILKILSVPDLQSPIVIQPLRIVCRFVQDLIIYVSRIMTSCRVLHRTIIFRSYISSPLSRITKTSRGKLSSIFILSNRVYSIIPEGKRHCIIRESINIGSWLESAVTRITRGII